MSAGRPLLRAVVGTLLVATLAACGLPLTGGVQRPGQVAADQRLPEPISVLPPGPQPGAAPDGVVIGFLTAQTSGRDRHGIARSFLAPAAQNAWHDDAGVTVYDQRTAVVRADAPVGDTVSVSLSVDVVGTVGPDGAARAQVAQPLVQRYRLRRDAQQQWRLVQVPPGVTLPPAARDRSYDPVSVYFLAPPGPTPSSRHLVADLLRLPTDGDRPRQLVEHLLAGPSTGVAGSVETAVPRGTTMRSLSSSASGEVQLDLSGPASALSGSEREQLSAQLVWTLARALPSFTRLRLLVDGRPLDVPGAPSPQPRTAWAAYDPDAPQPQPTPLGLDKGQLVGLQDAGDDVDPQRLADQTGVVDLAEDPRGRRIAVLTQDGATRTLRVGPLAGPLDPGYQAAGLRSPTWGSGDLGLWLLQTGARPQVLLFPLSTSSSPVAVPVDGLPALGDDAVLRVSRDGARVALVAGATLYVGRVQRDRAVPRVVGLRRLAGGVLDVAWRTGTTLQVLVEDTEPPLLPLLRVSVDGTTATYDGLVGAAEGTPVALAAYGDAALLVETRTGDRSTVYSGSAGSGFEVRLRDATRPAYPR